MPTAAGKIATHATPTPARFAFGRNWRSFLQVLTPDRINEAKASLAASLDTPHFAGKTFLDIGCGSGLFSLAAAQLGAGQITSIDFDQDSVWCARELKRLYFADKQDWRIDQGDILDPSLPVALGKFDFVYAWGVLHHTGAMMQALAQTAQMVRPGGKVFISIYNDQGGLSKIWTVIKRNYCQSPARRALVVLGLLPLMLLKEALHGINQRGNPFYFFFNYKEKRGMSLWHDIFDWLGGYPFEVATPEAIHAFFRQRGFVLTWLKTCNGHGINQFVFELP